LTGLLDLAGEAGLPIRFGALVLSPSYYGNAALAERLVLDGADAKTAGRFFQELATRQEGENVSLYYHDAARMVLGAERTHACMMGYYGMVLECDGFVYPCVNCESKSFGDLRRIPLWQLWRGSAARQVRQELHDHCCVTCPSICYTLPGSASQACALLLARARKRLIR
jgi:MoaA/NifB/PqqE/SkfB family radical SAM enzyme